MPSTVIRGMCAALLPMLLAWPSGAAERLNDKEVKKLLEQVDHDRDRFEDRLDGKVKRSIIRGPRGEVDVERYLDDLQENVDRLKERFAPEYAASAEASTVLRQGSDIHRYIASQPANLQGASEWHRLASSLGTLAKAYGTTFPLAESATARRMNDRELVQAAKAIAKGADQIKREVRSAFQKNASLDTATLDVALQDLDALKREANALASRVDDGDPALGEAKQVVQRAARIEAGASGRALPPAAQSAWASVRDTVNTVAQGFGIAHRSGGGS